MASQIYKPLLDHPKNKLILQRELDEQCIDQTSTLKMKSLPEDPNILYNPVHL
jgi:hypothetical protein